jgi:hypothetical protein
MKKTTFERQGLAIRNQKKLQIPTENKPVRSCPEAHNCVRFEKIKDAEVHESTNNPRSKIRLLPNR